MGFAAKFQSHNGAIAAIDASEFKYASILWFQSHNGAIAASKGAGRGTATTVSIPQWCDCCQTFKLLSQRCFGCFNPTMVRLLHEIKTPPLWHEDGFNPTMVRLLHYCSAKLVVLERSFNPTMVRLLQVRREARRCAICWFQSHNGAIAAKCRSVFGRQTPTFQSHNGAIAAEEGAPTQVAN